MARTESLDEPYALPGTTRNQQPVSLAQPAMKAIDKILSTLRDGEQMFEENEQVLI